MRSVLCCLIASLLDWTSLAAVEFDQHIQVVIDNIIKREKIPGVVAGIADEKGLRAIAASGLRKQGVAAVIRIDDKLHLGSCTKAMTAVLIATLVDDNKILWDLSLEKALPQLSKDIHATYRQVTLWDPVTHRAGLPANANDWWSHQEKSLHLRRLAILRDTLAAEPKQEKGAYLYSNLSYMLAACMVEELTGETWETLVQERVFQPLKMTSAGFGMPGLDAGVVQPWGHVQHAGNWVPRFHDNAEALGPAGRVHCSLADWASFQSVFMRDSKQRLLSKAQVDRLLQPVGQYAAGWIVVERGWAKGIAISHDGSNTMWYAMVSAQIKSQLYGGYEFL